MTESACATGVGEIHEQADTPTVAATMMIGRSVWL